MAEMSRQPGQAKHHPTNHGRQITHHPHDHRTRDTIRVTDATQEGQGDKDALQVAAEPGSCVVALEDHVVGVDGAGVTLGKKVRHDSSLSRSQDGGPWRCGGLV